MVAVDFFLSPFVQCHTARVPPFLSPASIAPGPTDGVAPIAQMQYPPTRCLSAGSHGPPISRLSPSTLEMTQVNEPLLPFALCANVLKPSPR